MKHRLSARGLSVVFMIACVGCGQELEAPSEETYVPLVTSETPQFSFEPIQPEETGDDRFFFGAESVSDITYGGFEIFSGRREIPDGWEATRSGPKCRREHTIVRHGKSSVKLTGHRVNKTMLNSVTAPEPEDLRGKRVVFGMWIYTPNPDKVHVQIVENLRSSTELVATKTDEWELLKVTRLISNDVETVQFVVTLNESNPPAICYADGAALIVREPVNILENGGFENWASYLPVAWNLDIDGTDVEPTQFVTRLSVPREGGRSLRLRTHGKRVTLSQSVNVTAGNAIYCEAYVKNPVPNGLSMSFVYDTDGETVSLESEKTKGADWTRFHLRARLPSGVRSGSAKLVLTVGEHVKSAVILDSISVKDYLVR